MHIQFIDFATPAFDEAVSLRDEILRKPLNLQFEPEDLAQEWNSYHLAYYDDKNSLQACLVLKPLEESMIKMRQVAVRENLQKQGIGTLLVNECEAFCDKIGFKRIILHARKDAVPFYKKLGYKTQGKMFEEVGIPHCKMYKNL